MHSFSYVLWDYKTSNFFFVPLKQIYDEILVNAADNKVRDPSQSLIKVNIDKENNEISIMNNGKGEKIVFELCQKTKWQI